MILKYPYPYKSWFTIANDPDNTLINDWHEINSFVWNTLGLPISNSLFVKSFNHNIPNQVNLIGHPEILSQKHDIIHTWGDYMHSRSLGFDRKDAIEACEILVKNSINPKVWIDHSQFVGNLLHSLKMGSIPQTTDASGIVYENYVYTLDLIKQIGIRYIWDGNITHIVGQDRTITPLKYFMSISTSTIKAMLKTILFYVIISKRVRNLLELDIPDNRQYFPNEFPDGNKLYCFTRYGTWEDADIYGLGRIISQEKIDMLIKNQSTMVVYTHLGKRPASKITESFHIPIETKAALQYIKNKYDEKVLMVSPLSELLDFLVIRDNIKYDPKNNLIEVIPDGIRYQNISQADVSGKKISFDGKHKFDLNTLKVITQKENLVFDLIIDEAPNIFSIKFK